MAQTTDEIKVKELSTRLNKILGAGKTSPSSFKSYTKPVKKDLSFLNKLSSVDVVKMKAGKDGMNGKDGSPDTAQQIADKLNTLVEAIEASVIKGLPKVKDLIDELKKGQYLEPKNIKGLPINMNDMRWHGSSSGLSSVSHDATLTGLGTAVSPLSVVASFGTEVSGEIVSGTGTTFTLAHVPIAVSVKVYALGRRQIEGALLDYTIAGAVITTTVPWNAGEITADYRY